MSTRNFRVKNGIDIGSAVTIDGSSGIITATTFIGDGSGLINVTSTGSGVEIKDNGATVGVAATIEFGSNINVSPLSAGIVTVTAPDQGIAGIDTTTTSFFNDVQIGGAVTATTFIGDGSGLTGVVGSGSGIVIEENGATVGTAGTINFVNLTVSPIFAGIVTVSTQSPDNFTAGTLNVTGVSTFVGDVNISDANVALGSSIHFGNDLHILQESTGDTRTIIQSDNDDGLLVIPEDFTVKNLGGITGLRVTSESTTIKSDDSIILSTSQEGVTLNHTTSASQLNVSQLNITGISTFNSNVDMNTHVEFKASSGNSSLYMYDENSIILGSDNDARIIYNDSGNIVKFERLNAGEIEIDAAPVTLQHSDSTKLQTSTSGINVFGGTDTFNLKATGISTLRDVEIYRSVGDSYIDDTGSGTFYIRNTGAATTSQIALQSSAVELYYGDSKKFETTTVGVGITGELNVSGDASFNGGAELPNGQILYIGEDLEIVRTTTNPHHAQIKYTGTNDLKIQSDDLTITNELGTKAFIDCNNNTTHLYYNNYNRLSTEDAGVSIGGTVRLSGGVTLDTNNTTIVGTSGTTGEIKQIGGAPFFYDGTAWREFVLSSGTPVTQSADTDWDNVALRLTFDSDLVNKKLGDTGAFGLNTDIVASPVRYGTGSLRSQTGVGATFANRPEYDFTGPWTMEFWIYVDSISASQPVDIISKTNSSDSDNSWRIYWQTDQYGNYILYWSNSGNTTNQTQQISTKAAVSWNNVFDQKWAHIAITRVSSDGTIHCYINGLETSSTYLNGVIDNDIQNTDHALYIGGSHPSLGSRNLFDGFIDDFRFSTDVKYDSISSVTQDAFTRPTTALPITGTLSSVIDPPGDKYGEIVLGSSPSWTGTSGVNVTQESAGNYRLAFTSSYTDLDDYFVLTQPMDQGFASYVGVARSTGYVDFTINKQSDDSTIDTGSLAVQITNHI